MRQQGKSRQPGQGMGPDSNIHQVTSACTSKRKGTRAAAPHRMAAGCCVLSRPLAAFARPAGGHPWLKPGANSSPQTAEIICTGQCWALGPVKVAARRAALGQKHELDLISVKIKGLPRITVFTKRSLQTTLSENHSICGPAESGLCKGRRGASRSFR